MELLQKYLKNIFILRTGCKSIDNLLHGGLYSSELTEIYGESNTGKTRLCLNIAANLLASTKSTLNKDENSNNNTNSQLFRILYIDSCNNFCSKLFSKILKSSDPSLTDEGIQQLLKLMSVMHCENIFHLLDILTTLEKESKLANKENSLYHRKNDQTSSIEVKHLIVTHLIIIENFNLLFNNLRNSYNELLSNLHYVTRNLKYLCDYLNISILVVNTTSAERYKFHQTWNSLPNVRLLLANNDNSEHRIEIVKHTRVASNTFCTFEITENGLK